MDIINGNFRPLSSDRGAHRSGPVAKPSTYSDNPSIPTSVETPNCRATAVVAAEKILLVKAAVNVVYPSIIARNILIVKLTKDSSQICKSRCTDFFFMGQF